MNLADDDRELWKQICGGNAKAFDMFYRENAPRVRAFVRQIVRSPQVAEDITQEVFTNIWSRPNGFQPDRGPLRAYLYGIGRKKAAEWWRRQSPGDAAEETEARSTRTETISIVGDAFRRISPDQQILLWLREVEGQSYAELARSLDIPVGTVRSRLFAAREALRRVWKSTRQDSKEGA
jgi:RNA polymerase sigma-70 factor (ECF subfamily)